MVFRQRSILIKQLCMLFNVNSGDPRDLLVTEWNDITMNKVLHNEQAKVVIKPPEIPLILKSI